MEGNISLLTSTLPLLFKGALVTLEVSALAILLGIGVGLLLAMIRLTRYKLLKMPANLYISFVRGTPLLIQIFIVFYSLPAIGLDIPAFQAGVLALSLNSGAFVAEIIRGGIQAIPRGQVEAAQALGMPKFLIVRRIILPQVWAVVIPPLTNEFITILKASPLLSIITVVELTRAGQQIVSVTYRPVEIYLLVAVLYLIINFSLARITGVLERRAALIR